VIKPSLDLKQTSTALHVHFVLLRTLPTSAMASTSTKKLKPAQVVIKPPKKVFPRREIRDLLGTASLTLQRDLFLLALKQLMAVPSKDSGSFYQIGGIHGEPYAPYDRVGLEEAEGSEFGGYCWHGSQLFPTWHRPYLMLIEQELRAMADGVIEGWEQEHRQFPKRGVNVDEKIKSYKEVAEQLRFPYLDWASMDSLKFGLPDEVMGPSELKVNTPFTTTEQLAIPNPLKAFVLPEDVGEVQTTSASFNPMSRPRYQVPPEEAGPVYTPKGYATVRYPDNNYDSKPYDLLYNNIRDTALVFRPSLSYMFALDTWAKFSNTSTGARQTLPGPPPTRRGVSLEGVHNGVHNSLGGPGGHMTYTEVAGFDPIFFLHHCNVDRLLALWQSVYDDTNNPETWVQKVKENGPGTWTYPGGELETSEDTPLTPFRKRQQKENDDGTIDQDDLGAFYTSKDVRSLEGLGYTYPEILEWKGLELKRAEKLTKINQMYSGSINYEGFRLHAEMAGIAKRQFQGPFSIQVFVGYDPEYQVTKDTPTKDNPHYAGSLSVFASSSGPRSKCAGCAMASRQFVDGSVDLTSALLKVGHSSSLGWSPADLEQDDTKALPSWACPPKVRAKSGEAADKTWADIQNDVEKTIKLVTIKADGSQADHVSIESLTLSWTRPYRLTPKDQEQLINQAGPAPRAASASASMRKLVEEEYLPAPVVKYLVDKAEAGTGAKLAAARAVGDADKTRAKPAGDLLFVGVMP